MKKTLITVGFLLIAAGAYAADFSDLQTFKVTYIKASPVQPKAVNEKQLSIPETVESVGTTVASNKTASFTLRYVLEKYDIYPQLRVEIFQIGYEGEATVVNAAIDVYPGAAPAGDSQIEDVSWAGYTLNFKLNGKSCVFDLGKNLSKLGKDFENAASLKYSCGK